MAYVAGGTGVTGGLSKFSTATVMQANGGVGGTGETATAHGCCPSTFANGTTGTNGTASGPTGSTSTAGGGAAGGTGGSRQESCNCVARNVQTGGNGGNGAKSLTGLYPGRQVRQRQARS